MSRSSAAAGALVLVPAWTPMGLAILLSGMA
jgi:hypothetical protein